MYTRENTMVKTTKYPAATFALVDSDLMEAARVIRHSGFLWNKVRAIGLNVGPEFYQVN